MCIRDRSVAERACLFNKTFFIGKQDLSLVIDNLVIAASLVHTCPVSYTHLDVYKRQILSCSQYMVSASSSSAIAGNVLHAV